MGIGLNNYIKVIVIRNAAGIAGYPLASSCRPGKHSIKLPSSCASNSYGLYDPDKPRKLINIANFFGADSTTYAAFDRYNLNDEMAMNCEVERGDFIVFVWAPLLDLRKSILKVMGNVPSTYYK